MKKLLKISALVIICFALATLLNETLAQCPMCKMAAESNLKSGGSAGKGLNMGILYMFVTPYLLVGTLGYIWWRNRKKNQNDDDYLNEPEVMHPFSQN